MSQKIFALVDCNAFFCNCERLFRPELKKFPVGVLSNNDGCFVSLTRELKDLGVKMGEPYFKVKDICKKHQVKVFSSNFSLYSNISDRVMLTLAGFTPSLEVYSVDEAFLDLTGFKNLEVYARNIKDTVEQFVGIPVCVGVAPTKTLAKVANRLAKKSNKAEGVVVLLEKKWQDLALQKTDIEDVWGVGRASSLKMRSLGIKTAKDYRDYKNERQIKKIFTKVGLQRKEELMGLPRFELEVVAKPKKQIISSRTFGSPVYHLQELRESVANYMSSACEKLRKQNSNCAEIGVFMRTSPFKNTPQYKAFEFTTLLSPTSDTRKAIRYAFRVLDHMYKAGFEYKKAGVQLGKITSQQQTQLSLLSEPDSERDMKLMQCIDQINARDGSGTVRVAACGLDNKAWKMNRNHKSPRYVSGWSQLKKVY